MGVWEHERKKVDSHNMLAIVYINDQGLLSSDLAMQMIDEPILRTWRGVPERTEANRLSLGKIKSIPREVALTFWAIDWFSSVSQFRNEETDFLCEMGKFEATLDCHRAIIAELISQGETLVMAIRQHGLVPDAGFSVDDIRATIDCLRETFRGVHGPHNHPETNRNINAILEAA
jgi:hypothetical protein